jgi:hypothetical protein
MYHLESSMLMVEYERVLISYQRYNAFFFVFILYALQILKDIAQSRLKSAADEHWSDGALEVNLLISNISVLIIFLVRLILNQYCYNLYHVIFVYS